MKPLALLALVLLAACTPAPSASTPPSTTTTTVTPEVAPETAIREVFDRYVKALNAKDTKAALSLTSSSAVRFFEDYRQHALRSTEVQLEKELFPGPRLFVYLLRGRVDPELLRSGNGHSLMSFAIEHGLFLNQTKPTLENLTIKGDGANAEIRTDEPYAPKAGKALLLAFGREGRQWTVHPTSMIFNASRGIDELAAQKGISADQVITEVLTAQFGAARAAELRKPING